MKKFSKTIFKILGLTLSLLLSAGFISCGDDDEPDVPEVEIVAVDVQYVASVGDAYTNFWDVQLTYTNAQGKTVTEPLTSPWSQKYHIKKEDKIPTTYTFKVYAYPKQDAPHPDPDAIYSLKRTVGCVVWGTTSDGKEVLLGGNPSAQPTGGVSDGKHIIEKMSETNVLADESIKIEL